MTEITLNDLRALCGKIVDRGAPATAIHMRDILKQIYGFAVLHGERLLILLMKWGGLPSPTSFPATAHSRAQNFALC